MKKFATSFLAFVLVFLMVSQVSHAQGYDTYIVKSGDSMWKISVKYQIGLSEIINANPQIKNPAMIYPNQKLNIPNIDNVKGVEQQVVQLTNQERAKQGLKPLQVDWELARVARYKSADMQQNNYFSHQSARYGSPFDMMKQFGIKYRTAGENIAKGQTSAQAVVQSWMKSEGHRKNIMNPQYTHIGVGYVESGHYWTQLFIGK